MRYLMLAALAVALLGAGVGAARGAPIVPFPPNTAPEDTVPSDVVFSTEITVSDQPGPDGGMTTVDPDTGVTYMSGCRQVDVAAVAKSFLFKDVIYRFHQIKFWCWHRGVVYDERHAWSFEGSSTACLNAVYPPNAWFFAWRGFAQGGHYSEERAHVTNCVFKIGVWNQLYPDVKIWAHSDGTYDASTAN